MLQHNGTNFVNVARKSALMPTGALAETYSRATGGNFNNVASFLTSQRVHLVAIELWAGMTITSISFLSGTQALVTGVHQLFGLYDSALALLRSTTDDTSTAWAASTVKTLNLTSTYPITANDLYYLAILVDATTVPGIVAGQPSSTVAYGLSPKIQGFSSTGRTTLPNPAGAMTVGAGIPWAYVS